MADHGLKVHGEAVPVGGASAEEPLYAVKSAREPEAKAAIAAAAAALVAPGSVVAISAGSTAYAVAARLLDVPELTVVTNSLPVAELLRTAAQEDRPSVPELLLAGGTVTPSAALVGPLADLAIRSLHVDLLILGAHGVSATAGLTTPNMAEAQTNRALVAAARRRTVVADHTKWGVIGLCGFAALEEIDCFITDEALPDEAQDLLAGAVGELVTVPTSRQDAAR
ncbi:DeoR family transcriptional regulator [Actinocorallia sp. A-T 12471]|uniref:DeoR/GlpR family DNA-binding transcription regulator n=1 Tax=Actinocorallia sp. A-T 12471 TaxID=3089813 RepID=UPI0029D2BB86|nr:DeoR family transcriptional regulator [Actinocorallia sp. A-T 12471]MDX6740609.1 DeoR family transcriptional regulator [Actinocorallia sp. A-T 12471]